MTKLTHAIKSHIPTMDQGLYSVRTDTTGDKRGRFMAKLGRLATISSLFVGVLVLAPRSGCATAPADR